MLPALGTHLGQALVPLLLRLTADTDEPVQVRAGCTAALCTIDFEPDAEVWQVLGSARSDDDIVLRCAATWAWCELGRYEELGLVKVPAGEFLMGSDRGDTDEKPEHRLYLPDFYIARLPVTVAQYRGFVEQSGHEVKERYALKGAADHPVVRVSWYDAGAFAEWHGCSLPSEAEWEKAARGTDGRQYPWGDEWRDGLANTWEYRQQGFLGRMRRVLRRERRSTTPVGHFSPAGDSPYGCTDMAGNVWEWTRSLWGFDYPYEAADGREDEGASTEVAPVVRGGSFNDYGILARCSFRHGDFPELRLNGVGFRVAVLPFPLISEASDL